MNNLKIHKQDTVKVIAGKEKGKTGKVVRVLREERKVAIEGVNVVARHIRPRKGGEKGQKIYFPAPLAISKVMLICPKCTAPTRVGYQTLEGDFRKKKERVCKKCKALLGA
ncbi:MAG: 50S ribosomal protein L24 [Patescibacteria group bacterium]